MTKIEQQLKQSRKASLELAQWSLKKKNEALEFLATLIEKNSAKLLLENAKDLKREKNKLSRALYQRLSLDESKLKQVVQGIRDISSLPDPVNSVLSETLLDDGLVLQKVSVPLGVVGVIFESRPDVLPQVLSLMLKSGNAVVLKGGSEAMCTNKAFAKIIAQLDKKCALPKGWAQLILSRKAVHEILKYPQYVSLVIPRGSNALVQSIMKNTKIPVMGHADGICHLYIHEDANIDRALALSIDSKTQYPSACNAIETLLVHKKVAKEFLSLLFAQAKDLSLELRGCVKTKKILPQIKKATLKDWATEYSDLILSVKIVESQAEAIEHISTYGSGHTDAIVSQDPQTIEHFFNSVDSAGVFANASTRFADGFRYGFGAEVGISTAKIHARGPVGLEGLTIYKYRLKGEGHLVSDYVGSDCRLFKHKKLY
ncbi:MAG: glutamate-5-semialdehyde dehydrogenase [Bdellovibrionota bacterium]